MAMWTPFRRRAALAITGIVVVSTTLCLLGRPTPQSVMADFYAANHRAEDMLMDPLILNADIVAPKVITEVRNPNMPLRRYAISFLGNERVQEALPTLRSILHDGTERDYFRADALESIFQIDQTEGNLLAKEFSSNESHLGYIARGLLDGSHKPFHRTRWQARIGHHE